MNPHLNQNTFFKKSKKSKQVGLQTSSQTQEKVKTEQDSRSQTNFNITSAYKQTQVQGVSEMYVLFRTTPTQTSIKYIQDWLRRQYR